MICCYEMRKGRGSCVEPSSLKNFGSMFDAEAIHAQIPSNIEPNYQLDRPIQVVEVVEQFAKEQLVVRLYSSIQRQTQRGQLFAQASFSQLGQDLRVRLPLLDGLEHTSPTDSDHIPGYRSQFHVSCFQHLVDAIDLLGAQLDKLLTISRQISQDPDRWWRNKAWTQ